MVVSSATERSGETVPQASRSVWPTLATRTLIAVFAMALLFTASAGFAAPPVAAQLSDQISTVRRSQLYSEKAMRKADRVIAKIKRQRKVTTKKLKRAQKIAKRNRRRHAAAADIVKVRQARLARAEARFADASEAPNPEKWKIKMRRLRRELRVAEQNRGRFGRKLRLATRARKTRFRRLESLKPQMKAAVRRREAAEAALAGRIVQMTRLAQQRANL